MDRPAPSMVRNCLVKRISSWALTRERNNIGTEPPPPPPAPPTRQACADRIETGIAEGRLTLTLRATPNASTALQDKLAASVKELATGILFDAARAGAGMTALPVNFRKSDTELHRYQIRRSADLGPDLAAIGAERLVHKAPVPIASPLR